MRTPATPDAREARASGPDAASVGARARAALPGLARALRRLVPTLVPALIVALPPLFWVLDGTYRASLTTLGRDQGIFQYIAWALEHGAKDYRDVRDVNGPLTHLIHLLFLHLGGADEHRFRVLDLTLTGATFALAGACLPGLGRRVAPSAPRESRVFGALGARRVVERAAWAFAAWVVLSGQYLLYIFWDLAQRESFFDWFLLSSAALQLVAQAGLRRDGARGARRLLALAGALSVVPWFGKPTFVIFTLAQMLALAVDDEVKLPQKTRFFTFAAGGVLGALTQIAFLVRYADVGAFLKIYLVDVPTMYRFIWPRSAVEIFSLPGVSTTAALSFATSAGMLGLILDRQMPRRALVLALFPLCGLLNVIVQSKGFPYHFHPVSAGLHLQWLAIVVWLWERTPRARDRARELGTRLAPFLAACALALKVALAMPASPHVTDLWILTKARDAEERASRDYLVYFTTYDFFPWELRQAAAYLREHTRPGDRVQTYGMDPYVLFLAERMSATPYIYAYDLNADAALAGGQLPEPAGLHPNGAEQARIVALRDEHERDMLARLEKDPPAAFVFIDKSPLISWQEAVYDFREHCPSAAAWVDARYVEAAVFDVEHVWLRRDLAPPSEGPSSPVAPAEGAR